VCALKFGCRGLDWDFVAILANKWNGGRQFRPLWPLRLFVDKIPAADSKLYGASRAVASQGTLLVCGDILS